MSPPLSRGPKPLTRRVISNVRPPYGSMDILSVPGPVPIAELSGAPHAIRVSPRRWRVGQVGLLDALTDPGSEEMADIESPTPTIRFIGRHPVRSEAYRSSVATGVAGSPGTSRGYGERILDGFIDAGKGLRTGYLLGSSGIYDTAGDAVALTNRWNDFMTQWTGIGTMTKDTPMQDVEDWLYDAAAQVAPRPEDYPTSIGGKFYSALAQTPAELAQYLTAARLVGPIAGLAGLNVVRESENGWEPAIIGGAKGATLGLAARWLDPLNWVERTAGLGSLGAASTLGEGLAPDDALANVAALSLFGALGVPRPKQPNLLPLQLAHNEFTQAAKHAERRLAEIRNLSQKRQKQLRVGTNQVPGLRLEEVVRKSDELAGYKVGRGGRYKLPDLPGLLDERRFDSTRSKWWYLKPSEVETKRETARTPRAQRLADFVLENEGVRIARRRENEVLRKARIQLGKEGRFDASAERLAQLIRDKMKNRNRVR